MIFSPTCSKIVYSSNRDDLVRPFVIPTRGAHAWQVSALALDGPRAFIARALAPDCSTLALVADDSGQGRFDVYLYDSNRAHLRNITNSPTVDDGAPAFSPAGSLLAFLSDSGLSLYDYRMGQRLAIPRQPASFTSVTWSEDGERVFLEDDQTNIWQYTATSEAFVKIWRALRPSFTPRMISNRGRHLLFISDHESDVTQAYEYVLETGSLKRVMPSAHDQYSPVKVSSDHYLFRSNIDGHFVAGELRQGTYRTLSPDSGVVYDFSHGFERPFFVYSDDRRILSIYEWEPEPKSLIPIAFDVRQPPARRITNSAGMTNLLYIPAGSPRA